MIDDLLGSKSKGQVSAAHLRESSGLLSPESGLLIEVAIFVPSNVAFLSSLWTKLAEIWYTFNLT